MGFLMGVIIDQPPKCYCKLAGEGIKCSLGSSRISHLVQEEKKENFRGKVRRCLSRDVLTIERVQKISVRARAYMLLVIIEKMVKPFNFHQCTLDCDSGL
jgi:hypothetical protein